METMVVTRKFVKLRFARGDKVPGTRSSHHFVPLSTSRIGHKLTMDESCADIFDFDLPTILDIGYVRALACLEAICNLYS